MSAFVVTVPVATLWSRPDAVSARDRPALAARPDIPAWIAAMSPQEQVDTEAVTQLLLGERVLAGDPRPDGWVPVVALDQPADRLHPRGYPGWLRAAHLSPAWLPAGEPWQARPSGADLLAVARRVLGAVYVWGGLSSYGLDCSGLVHRVWRRFGIVVPRDAGDQAAAATPVPEGTERAGDLYFFAYPGKPIHHVGIVVGPGRMVHASSVAHRVVEEPLTPDRVASCVFAASVGPPIASVRSED